MISAIPLARLQQRFGGRLEGDAACAITNLCTDSRALQAGDCFLAIAGERFDGHDFAQQAAATGASSLVVSEQWFAQQAGVAVPCWVVPDTLTALWQIATEARDGFNGPLIAVTGSSGKTTVKQMLAAIGEAAFGAGAVLYTQGNLNNHIGVPLTLLQLQAAHRFAVIEMGASGPGEIAPLSAQARPTVSVVNNVMGVHVEGFGSLAGVAETKAAIYDGLGANGVAVINLDDAYAKDFANKNRARATLGFAHESGSAQVFASNVMLTETEASFTLNAPGGQVQIQLPVPGAYNVANALCASACAIAAGVALEAIARGLARFQPAKGRYHIVRLDERVTLIDDTYNANPAAVKAALQAQTAFDGARWLALGDMGELGADERAQHAEVGDYARAMGVEVYSTGRLSDAAGGKHFATQAALVAQLQDDIRRQAGPITILIKGSRSARMELVVQALTDNGGQH